MGGMMSMMRMNVLLENNILTSSLNFENGKILAKSKQYYGREVSELLDDYEAEDISPDLINRVPSGDVAAVFAVNFDPEGIREFLKITGLDGLANLFLSRANYSMDELIRANKGQFLIAFSDLALKPANDTGFRVTDDSLEMGKEVRPDVKILFATAVNDKASFEKLIGLLEESSKESSKNLDDLSYEIGNNWFAASNSPEQTNRFLEGGNNNLPFAKRISGHPFGGYVDLQKIMGTMYSGFKDSSEKEALDASLKIWQDVVATGGDYENKSLQYEVEINLMDKNTNSLKQLNPYFDTLSRIWEERKKRRVEPDLVKGKFKIPDRNATSP
jgi:hypothetical protein